MRRINRASEPGSDRRRTRRVARTATALGLVFASVVAAVLAAIAVAAVPTAPDNIVVFPDRDFVTLEGFQDHLGDTALVEVTRGGTVVGSAKGVVQAGDVAFEINHPGGYCWGAGTALNVTPDIRAGDKVSVKFGSALAGDTTVQDTAVDTDTVLDGTTVTVRGRLASDVNRAQLEQRIVNPGLRDTPVARRDVRAVPGPMTPAPRGGYSSSLESNGDRFVATYDFSTAAAAATAAHGGGERMMAWQVEDGAANRQGLTIAEYGEAGGPGMGGCPAGPADLGAPKPGGATVVRSSDKTQVQVNWTAASAAPGSAPVDGYSVSAIADTWDAGQQAELGRRTGANATRATITGLTPGESYRIEVRSLAGPRMSDAFDIVVPAPTPSAPGGDQVTPVVKASPPPTPDGVTDAKSVTLASEATADIYYTTDGSPALDNGDLPSDSARPYTGPIAISTETRLRWVAFDPAGNFDQGFGTYAPPKEAPVAPPSAPTLGASSAGEGSVTLRWSSSDPSTTGYGVQLFDHATGTAVGDLRETADTSLTIGDLTPGTAYSFTVKAQNGGGWSDASGRSAPITPKAVPDRIAITSARWKAGDFRVAGTGTAVGATVTIRSGSATGPSLGTGPVTAAVAPATGGVIDLRFRNGAAPATRPATIYVVSSKSGVAGPITVG